MTWTSTKAIRQDLAAFITAHVTIPMHAGTPAETVEPIIAHAGPLTGQVNPPCAIVAPDPDEDYIARTSVGAEEVRLRIWLVARAGDPTAALDALDDMVDQLRPALQFHRSPSGREYDAGDVSRPATFTVGDRDLPGVSMPITTNRTVEAR